MEQHCLNTLPAVSHQQRLQNTVECGQPLSCEHDSGRLGTEVRLSEVLAGLSFALDLSEGQRPATLRAAV